MCKHLILYIFRALCSIILICIFIGTSMEVWIIFQSNSWNNHFTSNNLFNLIMMDCSVHIWFCLFEFSDLQIFFLNFGLYANTKRLFNTNPPKGDHLSCLDGIRFLSISWVMLGHILSGTMDVFPTSNISSLDISQRFEAQAVLNAFVSVDTFFLMSGCLISYLMLKELEKTKGRVNFLVMYIHRYLRYVLVCTIRYF